MPFYRAPAGGVHYLDDAQFANLLPAGCVEITEAEARPAPALSDIQEQLCQKIDDRAEVVRLKFITPGAGQMGVYLSKLDEAKRILADPAPAAGDYPLVATDIGLDAADLATAAQNVIAQFNAWILAAAAIEQIRRGTKLAIQAAQTVEGANAAYAAADWSVVE